MFHVLRKVKFNKKLIPCVFVWYPAIDNGCKFYNPQTKTMFQSRDFIFMEDKFDVEKLE